MPGVHHFPNGVVKIKYLTARELACVLLLGHFQIHTSDTLGLLQQHIASFSDYSQVCFGCENSLLLAN
jgi:hypothetical protein